MLKLHYNQLTALPDDLCNCTSLTEIHVHHNMLAELRGPLFQLVNLKVCARLPHHHRHIVMAWLLQPYASNFAPSTQVLDVSNNCLKIIPADVGWLPLTSIKLEGNPDLRVPKIVLERGFR